MKRIVIDKRDIDNLKVREVASLLKEGRIVGLPTETVYGLGAIYDNSSAVDRLYRIKKRSKDKPFTLCVESKEKASEWFALMPAYAYRLIERLWPGPLTIVYYRRNGNEDKVGIRVSAHPFISALLRVLRKPIFLPSANISGEKEATKAEEVMAIFDDSLDLIVDAGPSHFGKPSTVVDLTYHPFKVIREGVVSIKDLVSIFLKKRLVFVCTGNTCRSPMAEYLLKHRMEEKYPYLLDKYEIISRGILYLEGNPISEEVKNLLQEEGINVRDHRSRRLNREILLSSDLIIVMEKKHRDYILNIEPTLEPRIFLLSKFSPEGEERDIPDPISKPLERYRDVYVTIKEAVEELIDWLT